MIQWVAVYAIAMSGMDDSSHAVGHFPTQAVCQVWFKNFQHWLDSNGLEEVEWLGKCVREDELDRLIPVEHT